MAQCVLEHRDQEVRIPVKMAVHDCDLVVNGLRVMLEPHVDRLRFVPPGRPHVTDLLLIDPLAPDAATSLDLYRQHGTAIVLFTWLDTDALDTWLQAPGVLGHLLKTSSTEELVSAIETMAQLGDVKSPDSVTAVGDTLSPRERATLRLVAKGLTNQEIADHLYLTINTVKSHIRNAYRKIDVKTRSQAVAWVLTDSG